VKMTMPEWIIHVVVLGGLAAMAGLIITGVF
jgi:hypothetical protein